MKPPPRQSDPVDAYTLDQFVVFAAVVDAGGFASAARQLNRAPSAITYAIRALEERAGLVLFDRASYRATLTEAGRALLPRARRLLSDLADFQHRADSLAVGTEAHLMVTVDPSVSSRPMTLALTRLHAALPLVRVRMVMAVAPVALDLVRAGEAQLALLSQRGSFGSEFESAPVTHHQLVAVAAPSHPLAALPGPLSPEAVAPHMQVVWSVSSAAPDSPDHGVHALDCWHVSELHSKRELLLAGVGWGSMPDHWVADDLAAGRLVRLEMRSWQGHDQLPRYPCVVTWRREGVLGPAARLVIETLRDTPADRD